MSEGHKLGGARIPMHEMRRQRRLAAEKRNTLQKGSGQKLGGKPVSRNTNIRDVITDAVQRRQTITQGCGSGTRESERLANEATRNGFRTQAEEDQANDRAIAEALWELAQQDEANQEAPDPKQWHSDGLKWDPQKGLEVPSPHKRSRTEPDQPTAGTWFTERDSAYDDANSAAPRDKPPAPVRRVNNLSMGAPRPDSDTLGDINSFPMPPKSAPRIKPKVYMPEKPVTRPPPIQEHPAFRNSSSSGHSSDHSAAPSVSSVTSSNPAMHSPSPSAFMSPVEGRMERNSIAAPTPLQQSMRQQSPPPPIKIDTTWTCPSCTLVNPTNFLCCDACTNPRPCQGTIVDFSTIADMGPDALPTQSPMSPAELPGSGYFRSSTTDSIRHDSSYFPTNRHSSRPVSLPPTSMPSPLRTSKIQPPVSRTTKAAQSRPLGWKCACGAFMEDVWWTCSACGKMKESS